MYKKTEEIAICEKKETDAELNSKTISKQSIPISR
jgi:hypothetical protein